MSPSGCSDSGRRGRGFKRPSGRDRAVKTKRSRLHHRGRRRETGGSWADADSSHAIAVADRSREVRLSARLSGESQGRERRQWVIAGVPTPCREFWTSRAICAICFVSLQFRLTPPIFFFCAFTGKVIWGSPSPFISSYDVVFFCSTSHKDFGKKSFLKKQFRNKKCF